MNTEVIIALISAIGGAIAVAIPAIITLLQNNKSNKTKLERAMKILLRRELITLHSYYVNMGYITRIGLQEFEDTLSVYDELIGSNGYVEALADDIHSLRIGD